jgi:predicted dehydrogenase
VIHTLASNEPSPLRVALVGCGLISDQHLRAYKVHQDRAQVVACCDVDPARAVKAAELAGDARAASFDEILADPDIDAVDICTPPHLHPDQVIAAANAGKQIICQKPLARTTDECRTMIAAANDAGVVLYYGEFNQTAVPVVAARKAIADGHIGRLVGIQTTFAYWQGGEILTTAWRYDPKVAGGGSLLDSGIHAVNVMHGLGGPIKSVSCFTTNFRPELGGDDTATLNVVFEGGHLGTLYSSQAVGMWYPGANTSVFGTEGLLLLGAGLHGSLTLHRPDLPDRRQVLVEERGDIFAAMIGAFLDAAHGGENVSPGQVGLDDLRVVMAGYESARTGCAVDLAGFVG